MADADRPFAEWSYAVHCCRECRRTLLPAWSEISVDVVLGPTGRMRFIASNGLGGTLRRSLIVAMQPHQLVAGDEIIAVIVAKEFETVLNALPPDERTEPRP